MIFFCCNRLRENLELQKKRMMMGMKHITKRRFMIALMVSAAILLCVDLGMSGVGDLLGDVEKRPGEKGAEALFQKFGSNPWRAGEPWSSEQIASPQTGAALPAPTDSGLCAYCKDGNLTFRFVGSISASEIAIVDSCVLNATCNQTQPIYAPGAKYNVYAVFRGERYLGLWSEIV
jgi:hypothetical protein